MEVLAVEVEMCRNPSCHQVCRCIAVSGTQVADPVPGWVSWWGGWYRSRD
jgi:hypothetical protein